VKSVDVSALRIVVRGRRGSPPLRFLGNARGLDLQRLGDDRRDAGPAGALDRPTDVREGAALPHGWMIVVPGGGVNVN
jgi:hypothetical protein